MPKINNVLDFLKKRKKFVVVLAVLIIGIIGIFIFFQSRKEPIKSTTVNRGNIREELILSGEIDATEKASLVFPTAGKITSIAVKKGDVVKRSQTIATLDQATVYKNLQSSLLDFNIQKNTFEQTKDDQGVENPNDAANDRVRRILENNQYNLDKAVVSVELKELAKRDSILSSPVDGVVVEMANYFPGSVIGVTSVIAQIINPDTVFFSVSADQTEIVNLKEGDKCEIILDSFPENKLTGVINSISFIPNEDESGTVYEIEVGVFDLDAVNYRIGMSGDATFVLNEKSDILTISSDFIKTDEKGTYVYIDDKKNKRYIKTGLESDDEIEIIEGLSENEVVYD